MLKQILRWTFAWLPAAALAATVSAQSAPPSIAPPVVPPGQVAPQIENCLHGSIESAEEKARRNEALAAMKMIDFARLTAIRVYPGKFGWAELAWSEPVRKLKATEGSVGELARKINWGASEPLPGWTLTWHKGTTYLTPSNNSFEDSFAMVDSRDPCKFGYSSTDPEIANAGRNARVQPLDPK